jgi:hypothetical protein
MSIPLWGEGAFYDVPPILTNCNLSLFCCGLLVVKLPESNAGVQDAYSAY